jgi:hypothetical protein
LETKVGPPVLSGVIPAPVKKAGQAGRNLPAGVSMPKASKITKSHSPEDGNTFLTVKHQGKKSEP